MSEINYQIQDLFKVPLYKTALSLDNKAMANYCLSISKKDKGRQLSNIGGWQSDNLENVPELSSLITEIEKHTTLFTKEIGIECLNKVTNKWININGFRDINMVHSHPNCLISGVYYVQTPKDCGNIIFNHPVRALLQHTWLEQNIDNYTEYNSPEWWMPSSAGLLYLFPSWLDHFVKPNLNKKEKRISISFNI